MALTDIYRRHHVEIFAMADKLTSSLDPDLLKSNPRDVLSQLAQFAARINVHLSMEDKALYPKLLGSSDEECKSRAKEFQNEMGGIKEEFETYTSKWSNSDAISSETDLFIQETKDLFKVIVSRMEKENLILYPLADSL